MSHVLSIRFPVNLSSDQVAAFLSAWEQVGTWKADSERAFELHPHVGETLLLNCLETDMDITGYPEDSTFEFIEGFAERHGGELLYEGEPIREEASASGWKALGPAAKAGNGIAGVFVVLFTIVALPVFALIFVVRLAFLIGGAVLRHRMR